MRPPAVPVLLAALALVPVAAATTTPPGADPPLPCPELVAVEARADGVHLDWEPVAEAAAYNIYRAAQGEPLAPITSVLPPDTEFTDTDVEAGTTYAYMVTAYPHHGATESAGCDGVVVTAIPEFPALPLAALGLLGGVGAYRALRRR